MAGRLQPIFFFFLQWCKANLICGLCACRNISLYNFCRNTTLKGKTVCLNSKNVLSKTLKICPNILEHVFALQECNMRKSMQGIMGIRRWDLTSKGESTFPLRALRAVNNSSDNHLLNLLLNVTCISRTFLQFVSSAHKLKICPCDTITAYCD